MWSKINVLSTTMSRCSIIWDIIVTINITLQTRLSLTDFLLIYLAQCYKWFHNSRHRPASVPSLWVTSLGLTRTSYKKSKAKLFCDIFAKIHMQMLKFTHKIIKLTLSEPILFRLYTLLYWSNTPFLIFDIRAL